MAELFGFEIKRKKEEETQSIVSQAPDDGSIEIAPGGAYGSFVDIEGSSKNEGQLITRYRDMALTPECDLAIQDIVNEAIITTEKDGPVNINIDNLKYSKGIKTKIIEEFENILKILDFHNNGHEIFKKWYIDGRLYYFILIDTAQPKEGIKDLRYIDPRKIRKLRESKTEVDKRTGARIFKGENEYYLYNQKGAFGQIQTQGIKIAKDSICYTHSGIYDSRNNMIYSNLHKAIKPLNQLRMLEDAIVIYRLARAPERRIFYIDVGNLPKMKAEQYLRDMMTKHKNKLVYNVQTGEVSDDRRNMTMLEDFWLPRREGGKSTEITTLPGGQNLSELDDVDYFRRKLYKSLNVPITRMETENQFNLGRSSEITRDEVKFSKFIQRLRNRFSILFDNLLEIQLVLKGIITRDEWKEIKENIFYDFVEDNHFSELKKIEVMSERLRILSDVDQYTGKYFSRQYVRSEILKFTEQEINEMDKQIEKEKEEFDDEEMDDEDNKNNSGGFPQQKEPEKKPNPSAQDVDVDDTDEGVIKEKYTEKELQLIDRMSEYMNNTVIDDINIDDMYEEE